MTHMILCNALLCSVIANLHNALLKGRRNRSRMTQDLRYRISSAYYFSSPVFHDRSGFHPRDTLQDKDIAIPEEFDQSKAFVREREGGQDDWLKIFDHGWDHVWVETVCIDQCIEQTKVLQRNAQVFMMDRKFATAP